MSLTQPVVTRDQWLSARKALLAREKEFNKVRDALVAERRRLPMVEVDKPYIFTDGNGRHTLADLFAGKPQLLVYHFMLEPGWTQGCVGCSYVMDSLDGALAHVAARDTAFVIVSRAPLAEIEAFRARMGWKARWVSSEGSDFNRDFGVSFDVEDVGNPAVSVNYAGPPTLAAPIPGLSAFLRDGERVFHTYSTYRRGLESLMSAYNLLDLSPLGRHEEGLPFPMAWLKHHDRYGATQSASGTSAPASTPVSPPASAAALQSV
jgi:predicted dithiol-disulfide oxidoreductase (DUF899 family)